MSILSKVGHVLLEVLGYEVQGAAIAGPVLAYIFPGWGTLFNLIATACAKAETQYNPSGTIRGGGIIKKQTVTANAEALFLQYEKFSGNTVDRSAFIDGVIMAMNATK